MSGGFGGGSFGGDSFGGSPPIDPVSYSETITINESLNVLLPVVLRGAEATSPYLVKVTFSYELDPDYATNFDPSNYTIPSLVVTGVTPGPFTNEVFLLTELQGNTSYELTVATIRSIATDPLTPPNQTADFLGFPLIPRFFATAQSATKIVLIFSSNMLVNSALVDPASYTVTDLNGNSVAVVSATPLPDGSRVTLTVGGLTPGGYYVAEVVSGSVQSATGFPLDPTKDLFQWTPQLHLSGAPISIPFGAFSGEVTGGLLGQPAGQIFFSPALLDEGPNSVIEIDEVSLCTRAYDEYQFPQPVDPPPLFTFGAGFGVTTLGSGAVLWAPAERMGIPRVDLTDQHADTFPDPTDGPCDATLTETIDITKASFLNDTRWELFPGTMTFQTASNLAPIGPGSTTHINLEP